MKGVYFAEDFKKADLAADADGIELTARAALALKEELEDVPGRLAVICGSGNNGGDGYALCCLLDRTDRKFDVFGFEGGKSDTCAFYYKKLVLNGISVKPVSAYVAEQYDVTADCIFGTGINRSIEGIAAEVIAEINKCRFVISADIPSGLNADSGKIMGIAVRADKTVTFSSYKAGELIGGRNYCGKICVKDIGVKMPDAGINVIDALPEELCNRKTDTHKGDYGRIAVIGGSEFMPGAPFLTSAAAYRAGAGLVKTVVPYCNLEAAKVKASEEILGVLPVNPDNSVKFDRAALENLAGFDAVVCGPGMGGGETGKIVRFLMENYKKPLILDADALNSVKEKDFIPSARDNGNIILTPHIKEFSRLTDKDTDSIKENIIKEVKEFSYRTGTVLLLKGATTVVCRNGRLLLNVTGSPCMAKAGSGDVLSGIIAALAVRTDTFSAAAYGAFIHGKAGLAAENIRGVNSVIARDLIDNIRY